MIVKPDEAAELVAHLFESWYASLVRYALFATGSLDRAEDLVQTAFMDLYRTLRDGKRVQEPKGWIICALRRAILKDQRDRRRRGEDGLAGTGLGHLRGPSGGVPEAVEELQRLLSLLTSREREVLLLRLQALKYREIAEQLGVSVNSVKTLLARALKKLRVATSPASVAERTASYVEDESLPRTLQ